MKVTVAICTWNRAKLLDLTFAQMHRLEIPPGLQWEILVVNNNCTDQTDEVIRKHSAHLPIRRLFEPTPGKSHAANLAVAQARGELIVWTDDDVLVDPRWLAAYVEAAEAHPEMTFFGGAVSPWFEGVPPRWIARDLTALCHCFAIRELGPVSRPMSPCESPVGANMALRTDPLRQFQFDLSMGPYQKEPRNGEETDLIDRLRRAGHTGLWVGGARVQHYIPATRLTAQFVYKWFRWQARLYSRSWNVGDRPRLLWGAPRWLLRLYWIARLKAFLLSPVKNSAWLGAFIDSARWKGAIEQYRFDRPQRECPTPAFNVVGRVSNPTGQGQKS